MESRICIFLLKSLSLLMLLGLLHGCSLLRTAEPAVYSETEPVIKPGIERRTITEADIDSEDFEVGAFVGVMSIEDFGSNAVYGVRAAYHATEDFFFEAAAGATEAGKTSYETLSGGARLLTGSQRDLYYYNLSLGYNILPGESFIGSRHAFNSALYLMAGVGNTEFADDSHFSFNIGAGYRFLLNDWVALHLDFKDHIFESDLLGSEKYTHNLEGSVGLSAFF
ncbi:MAG: outer membrane beta-barrel domain-containing protein [Gammaproteobacteria bacterium]|nr:outer membrane beta-barrel domain-containing protein [Gammaproteobacteria bacterium]